MNRNELEQWMKESLDKKDFLPSEAGWDKLQRAINPPPKKKLVLALPAGMKIAASVALLVTAGYAIHFLEGNHSKRITHTTQNNGIAAITNNQPVPPPLAMPVDTPPFTKNTASLKSSHPLAAAHHYPPLHIAAASSKETIEDSVSLNPSSDNELKTNQGIPPKKKSAIANTAGLWQEHSSQRSHPLNLGVAAQVGRASVGNMQYQIGVVAHKNISGKFYAEAILALASTDVSQNQSSRFQSVSLNNGTSASVEEKSVDAQYEKNIISLGIAPNIGYRLTPHIAISGGVALYRNLNQSLTLKNEEAIDATAISNNVIAETKTITQWDAGLMGSANYQVNNQFTLHVQYRYGLSDYMYSGNNAIRNSGFNVGLKYLFGKH